MTGMMEGQSDLTEKHLVWRCVMRASMSRDGSLLGVLVVMLSAGVLGCSPAAAPVAPAKPVAAHADHDHGDDKGKDNDKDHDKHDDHEHAHPETLAAGVLELEKMWGHVKEALKAGDREKADDKVHAVGHMLEDFEALLAKEKAEAQEAGKKATQEVFD